MPRVFYAFFTLAVLYGIAGMALGLFMGGSEDFTLRPAHAHINLVGWLSLAVMGAFYGIDRGAPARLAWINFGFSVLGAVILPIGIGLIVTGHEQIGGLMALIGGVIALLGLATFLIVVLGGWKRAGPA